MKFGELATLLEACSVLAAALNGGSSGTLTQLIEVLRDHSNEKTTTFAKRVAKQLRSQGVGLTTVLPVVTFCKAASMPKQSKALEELFACSVKYGLDTAEQFRAALEAPIRKTESKPKASISEAIDRYAASLTVAGLTYDDAIKIISAIDADKHIKVNDARDIASRVVGVTMLKGRTRPQYLDEIRSRFIVLDREQRKREASEAVSKSWGDG